MLTKTYNALYESDDADGEEPAQLKLVTAPLAAAEELERLYTAQLIDAEVALPAALHALGCTPEEVERALVRAKEKNDEEREFLRRDREMTLKERESGLRKAETDAGTTPRDAGQPHASTAPSSSGSDE